MLQISTAGMESNLGTDFAEEYRNSKLYQCACCGHPNSLMVLGLLLIPRVLVEEVQCALRRLHHLNRCRPTRSQQLLLPQLVLNFTLGR